MFDSDIMLTARYRAETPDFVKFSTKSSARWE